MVTRPFHPLGLLVVAWSVGGVLALLGRGVAGLAPLALEALAMDLGPLHWATLVGWTVFMAYTEGYRGFQKRFSPRVVRRALYLGRHPRPVLVLVAPLFVMGLVHATRRRLVASWVLLVGIVLLVALVRLLAQPWRGIVDFGVVVGLSWGAASIVWLLLAAARGREPAVDPELPVSAAPHA